MNDQERCEVTPDGATRDPCQFSIQRSCSNVRRPEHAARRRVCAVSENEEFPLAHVRTTFPRLSPSARRTGGPDLRDQSDPIAERVRKIGGTTIRSIGNIARLQRVLDNDADFVTPLDMLAELRDDNRDLAGRMREAHALCDEHGDIATASLLEVLGRRGRAAELVPVRGIATFGISRNLTGPCYVRAC